MTEHAVVIVGGGPTGLMLAGELALAEVDVAIVEWRPSQELAGSRAGGLHSRTIEILDQRGIADRFVSEGQVAQVSGFAGVQLDISDFPTRHPYSLGLWQNHIERILAGWVAELPVTMYRGYKATGFTLDASGVNVELSDGQSLRADYLVGCDGGRSLIRKAAGIEFPGWDPTTSSLLAEVEMAEPPELGIHRNAFGIHSFGKVKYEIRDGEIVYMDGGPIRVMVTEQHVGPRTEPTLRDLSEALTREALAGEIKPYSQAEFNVLAAEGRPILLDFRADWCATCAAQAPVIRELMKQSKYKDLTTYTIDFDTDTALLKAYNVRAQSTLIVLTGKKEQGRSVGDTSREGVEHLLSSVAR